MLAGWRGRCTEVEGLVHEIVDVVTRSSRIGVEGDSAFDATDCAKLQTPDYYVSDPRRRVKDELEVPILEGIQLVDGPVLFLGQVKAEDDAGEEFRERADCCDGPLVIDIEGVPVERYEKDDLNAGRRGVRTSLLSALKPRSVRP